MIQPNFKETLSPVQALARIKQWKSHGARYIKEKSTQGREVYWVPAKTMWILMSSGGADRIVLGYYVMEECPCNQK